MFSLQLDGHKEFSECVLQKLGRIVPVYGADGKRVNMLDHDPLIPPGKESPMFNDVTEYLYF
jgi:hypothetical protein